MDYAALQYMLLAAMAIFFTAIALNRETMLSYLITGGVWLLFALYSFILNPSRMGSIFTWVGGLLASIFVGLFMYTMFDQYQDRKAQQFGTEPF